MNSQKIEHHSILKITCKDGSIRQTRVLGRYSNEMAVRYAQDVEGQNYKSVEVSIS